MCAFMKNVTIFAIQGFVLIVSAAVISTTASFSFLKCQLSRYLALGFTASAFKIARFIWKNHYMFFAGNEFRFQFVAFTLLVTTRGS